MLWIFWLLRLLYIWSKVLLWTQFVFSHMSALFLWFLLSGLLMLPRLVACIMPFVLFLYFSIKTTTVIHELCHWTVIECLQTQEDDCFPPPLIFLLALIYVRVIHSHAVFVLHLFFDLHLGYIALVDCNGSEFICNFERNIPFNSYCH